MLSSISSYIWGGNPDVVSVDDALPPPRRPRDESPAAEDWEFVGNQPAPGSLSGLDPLPPLTPSSNSEVSSAYGDHEYQPSAVEPLDGVGQDYNNTRVPVRAGHDLTAVGIKGLKASQLCRQRQSGKALSSKAIKRSNKAVMCGRKQQTAKYNMPIKAAGMNKNLKQC